MTEKTPKHVGWKVDAAINHLNAQWDLSLPQLHGADATTAEKNGSLPQKCSSRIRFLCFRTDHFDNIIHEFGERARQIKSEWVFKPSQERGTLPVFPVTKSMLAHEIGPGSGVTRLSESQRTQLLQLLFNILDEHFQLAKLSASYEPGSGISFTSAPTTPRKQLGPNRDNITTPRRQVMRISETVTRDLEEPELIDPMSRSAKRSLGSPNGVRNANMVLWP